MYKNSNKLRLRYNIIYLCVDAAFSNPREFQIFTRKFCKFILLMIRRFLIKYSIMHTLLFNVITINNTNIADMH